MRYAELRFDLPASLFPPAPAPQLLDQPGTYGSHNIISQKRTNGRSGGKANDNGGDEFSDDGLDDQDLLNAG